ncbi:MAG TPA: CBM35 domain-containing protein [Microlunatus sp.]|nr:CBM35 domain-containing protein [Microlunatus sp.]
MVAATAAGLGWVGSEAARAADPLPVTSRNSRWTRRGSGPLYWNTYGYNFPHDAPIPESEWKANLDWLARDLAPAGFRMACTDGWVEWSTKTTPHGYVVSYNDDWQHDWAYWQQYLTQRGMTLGVYYNPLWVTESAMNDPTKTVVGRPDVKVRDVVSPGDRFSTKGPGTSLYWVDVTRPGAKEYVQGYIRYFADLGVPYLRIDFLSWYETGTDSGLGTVGVAHGRENYLTALRWMNEAAGEDLELSLVMPHLKSDATGELRNGDLVRINADADRGGWGRLSGGSQQYQDVWPNWFNPFAGFTGWSHRSGRGQLILDGDFLLPSTFADDDERKTMINLMVVAGSPITIGDTYATIGPYSWVFTNPEIIELNRLGLVGKPIYLNAARYSDDAGSRDTERWAGQLPDGSWVVALFNRGDTDTVTKSIDFAADLGFDETATVRDLWSHTQVSGQTRAQARLAPHASRIFRITPTRRGRYQAVFAAWGGGANFNNNHANHRSIGFVDKLEAGPEGPTVTFAVEAPRSGSFPILYRYANSMGYRSTMTVVVEGVDHQPVQAPTQVGFPHLSSWDSWGSVPGQVTLAAGTNLITIGRAGRDVGAINLNYIDISF